MSDQEMLTLVESVITKRLNGDAYEEYSVQQRQFKGTSLKDLMATRDLLQNRIAATSGNMFTLGRGLRD